MAIHRLPTSFGQPWCRLAVQHPKLGSSPKRFDSGPLLTQRRRFRLQITWLACWSYWCDHMSADIVAGIALKAIRSMRSATVTSALIATTCWSE